MTPTLPSSLPALDCALLRSTLHIVPCDDRPDWLRCWQAELWHRHHPRSGPPHSAVDLYSGLLRDALWLRTEKWRRTFAGTALLCLATLAALVLVATLPLAVRLGGLHATCRFLVTEWPRFMIEAALTTVVGFAITSRTTAHAVRYAPAVRLRANLFLLAKIVLLQTFGYLLSLDIMQTFLPIQSIAIKIVQLQLSTVFVLLVLRWSFLDQSSRCRHCLRSLSAPLRVGPPSWNFLDSNGTQCACPDGHGILSVPEIETSWRQSSEWIAQ